MIPTITLSDADMAMARLIGNLRSVVNRCAKISDPRVTGDPLDIDENGMIAEFAFCKRWNVFLDPTPRIRSGGYDCILNKKKIDVKGTGLKNGRLLKTMKENEEVDCYALGIVDGNTVTFPGWAYSTELCQEKNIINLGHGPCYALDQKYLRQWKDQ